MTSSAALPETDLDDLRTAAETLAGRPVSSIRPVHGGSNNRVYRVNADGAVYALKTYPSDPGDPRDRLGAEFEGLAFLGRQKIAEVPEAVTRDRERGIALYGWVEGKPVNSPGPADVDDALAFLGRLHELRDTDGAKALPAASEACFSGADVANQVSARLARLGQAAEGHPDLESFLATELIPVFEDIHRYAETGYRDAGQSFEMEIERPLRTLSPSDFGFHNALRTDRGLVFLDFEYFGWDDPVKLTADFLLHPGFFADDGLKTHFARGMAIRHGRDDFFGHRLRLLYPLFGLRWVMILLNEFLPERLVRRRYAGATDDTATILARQLSKARAMLDRTAGLYEVFAYE